MGFTLRHFLFMDIELDVLVGHPDHEVLFIASQVARAAGLKDPSKTIYQYRTTSSEAPPLVRLSEVIPHLEEAPESGKAYAEYPDLQEESDKVRVEYPDLPTDPSGRRYQGKTAFMSEHDTYQMLLRGHAPESEPFRRWVTDVVLPSLRKTGGYSMHDSEDAKVIEWTGDMAKLADFINQAASNAFTPMIDLVIQRVTAQNLETRQEIREEIRNQTQINSQDIRNEMGSLHLPAPSSSPGKSPYEGTPMVHLGDRITFDQKTYCEVGSTLGLNRPSLDKLKFHVLRAAEVALGNMWATEDDRALITYLSDIKQKWNMYPKDWIRTKLNRAFYRAIIAASINDMLAKL